MVRASRAVCSSLRTATLGTVFAGKCRGLTVAIKKLKVEQLDPETLEDFRKEVSVLRCVLLSYLAVPGLTGGAH